MTQKMAFGYGIALVLIGILGLVPFSAPAGMLFGAFAVSSMNDAIYIVAGLLALAAGYSSAWHARLYFKVFGLFLGIMTIAGFIEGDTALGIMTVNAADNVFHLVAAALALWAGFGSTELSPVRGEGMAM